MTIIRLIVGLGNPGAELSLTRHNAGAWFIDAFCAKYKMKLQQPQEKISALTAQHEINGVRVNFALTTTPLNNCGVVVAKLADAYGVAPEDILIAHDDLSLLPGVARLKLHTTGLHSLHNGVRDVISHLGSKKFNCLRIGIGHPGIKAQVPKYVMSNPYDDEREKIDSAIQSCINCMPDILTGNFQIAMNNLHSPKPRFRP